MRVTFDIPMTKNLLASEANLSEYWTIKKKRHDAQKYLVKSYWNACVIEDPQLPCHIKITRIAPRKLDEDNMIYSMKWIKDAIAGCIIPGLANGLADSNSRLKWEYTQEKGPSKQYGIRIEIS